MAKAGKKNTSAELVSALRDHQVQLFISGGTKGALIRAPSPYRPAPNPAATPAENKPAQRKKRKKSNTKEQAIQRALRELFPPDGNSDEPASIVLPKIIANLGYVVSASALYRARHPADDET